MLPNPLRSEYIRYKKDTDAVAAWLAATARQCGFPADQLKLGSWDAAKPAPEPAPEPSTSSSAKSGRLKGKARKEAKKAAQTPAKPVQNPPKTTPTIRKYVVALADYVPLAKHIAASKDPVISVPHTLSVTINRVIALRSRFGERLAKFGAGRNTKEDLKHHYFVQVLRDVREALRPCMSADLSSSTEDETSASDDVNNMFTGLSVEESSPDLLNAPELEIPPQPTEGKTVYEAEKIAELEDVLFTYTMMMNDLARIRATIRWIWENYQKGIFDIAAAATATDTAVAFARTIIDEVEPSFKDFEHGTWGVQQKFFLACCIRKGYDIDDLFVDGKDNFNYDTYEIADECFINAHRSLLAFLDVLEPDQLPLIKEGFLGTYDPTSDRATKSGHAKFKEDQILLMEFLSELMVIIRLIPSYPVEDEFMRGVRQMDKTRKVTLPVVFAAQIFLDIHHLLREDASRASKFLQEEVEVLGFGPKWFLMYNEQHKLRIDNWPPVLDGMMDLIYRQGKELMEDPVYQCKVDYMRRNKIPLKPSMKPNRILDHSPVLAGLNLLSFRSDLYSIGIDAVNAWGSLQYTVHLYNALQQEKLLDPGFWPDLEVARTILKEHNFFPGGQTPTTAENYFLNYCAQMGAVDGALARRSAARAGSSRSLADVPGPTGMPRGIKKGLPVSNIFVEKYLKKTEVHWDTMKIYDIVNRSEFAAQGKLGEGTLMMEQTEHKKERSLLARSDISKTYLRPSDLIQSLVIGLQAETLEMTFPFLLLHVNIWSMFQKLYGKCNQRLTEIFGSGYIETRSQLPILVGYVFMTLSGKGPVTHPTKDVMQKAAEAIKESMGGKYSTMVLKMLKDCGHPVEFVKDLSDTKEEGQAETKRTE